MNAATPKKRKWLVIRVFVSSTFTDFKHERDALHQNEFRTIRDALCDAWVPIPSNRSALGRADGGRAGPPHHANRFEELRRCQQISPQPNFLILLGNRYGWRPLPEVISAEEFGILLTAASNDFSGSPSSATALATGVATR